MLPDNFVPPAPPAPPMDSTSALDQMPQLQVGQRLSEQLAAALAASIRDGHIAPGDKLPTEGALTQRFGVSRTVVREALSRLKTLGLVDSRQGSGVYVLRSEPEADAHLVLALDGSLDAVFQMVEVRRALEAESAALAAARRTPAQLQHIRQALDALESAVARGGDGVGEDVAFHRAIAQAAHNPFLLATLSYLSRFLLDATRVTRANEATRADFAQQVRDEHDAIVRAIEAGDVAAARAAGAAHMVAAAERIGRADPTFWSERGRDLAARLKADLGSAPPAPAAPPRASVRRR